MSVAPSRLAPKANVASTGNAIGAAKAEYAAETARKRAYNRKYMRRWRRNPQHRALERRRAKFIERSQSYGRRLQLLQGRAKEIGKPLCAMCRHKPPVMMVERLRATRSGFVRVELPYCGEC
jgi:hypothetical protein